VAVRLLVAVPRLVAVAVPRLVAMVVRLLVAVPRLVAQRHLAEHPQADPLGTKPLGSLNSLIERGSSPNARPRPLECGLMLRVDP